MHSVYFGVPVCLESCDMTMGATSLHQAVLKSYDLQVLRQCLQSDSHLLLELPSASAGLFPAQVPQQLRLSVSIHPSIYESHTTNQQSCCSFLETVKVGVSLKLWKGSLLRMDSGTPDYMMCKEEKTQISLE